MSKGTMENRRKTSFVFHRKKSVQRQHAKVMQGCRNLGVVGLLDFGRSANPYLNWGVDYAPSLLLPPPDFKTFRHPC